jgi:hypothetical protein
MYRRDITACLHASAAALRFYEVETKKAKRAKRAKIPAFLPFLPFLPFLFPLHIQ